MNLIHTPVSLGELADKITILQLKAERIIQDGLREREKTGTFDDEFIRLARAVMTTNAARVKLKNDINHRAGSAFIEEKQYKAEPGN